jgi:hypothetical protein
MAEQVTVKLYGRFNPNIDEICRRVSSECGVICRTSTQATHLVITGDREKVINSFRAIRNYDALFPDFDKTKVEPLNLIRIPEIKRVMRAEVSKWTNRALTDNSICPNFGRPNSRIETPKTTHDQNDTNVKALITCRKCGKQDKDTYMLCHLNSIVRQLEETKYKDAD